MKITKRILLFVSVNILIIATLSAVMSFFNVQPYLDAKGINYQALLFFCVVWGFGASFLSLSLSRIMAKWMMGVKLISPETTSNEHRAIVSKVHDLARRAGIAVMPEVGIYEADELNAFATGPTRNRSLVVVSSGLVRQMNNKELEGVLAHEVAHIANGDMVTMTLVQGVINAFVMFLARVVAFFASQFVDEEKRSWVQFGVIIVLEIFLGMLGMIVVAYYSRRREYKADSGGVSLSNRENMIAALEKLKKNSVLINQEDQNPSLATLKISGKVGGLLSLFSTHPDLNKRILRLKSVPQSGFARVNASAI